MALSTKEFIEQQNSLTISTQTRLHHGYLLEGIYSESDMILKTKYRFAMPNKVRIEVFMPEGGYYTEGYNGDYAWELAEVVHGRKDAALRHGAEWLNPLKSVKMFIDRGNLGEYLGIVEYRSQKYHEMKLTQKDGFERSYYFDLETYLVRYALDNRPLHPQDDWINIETEFTNYQQVKNINFPMTSYQTDLEKEERMTELKWETVLVDPKFDDNEFEKRSE